MASAERNQPITHAPLASLVPALRSLCSLLKVSRAPGMVIGGVAASLLGQARATADVDATILLDEQSLDHFLELAVQEGLRPRIPEAAAFAKRSSVLLLEHEPTRVGVDLTIGRLPFEREAIARARSVLIGDLQFPLVTPEDLIVMKAVAHRPQDLQDIRAIIVANPRLNVARIRAQVREFAKALEMPELWADVAALWVRHPRGTRRRDAPRRKRRRPPKRGAV